MTVPVVRDHEFPPKWDGAEVRWSDEAMPLGAVFACDFGDFTPVPDECPGCEQVRTLGTDLWFGKMRDAWVEGRGGRPGYWTWPIRLVLYRCTRCEHDQVTDLATDETWDLDESDYGENGSTAPPAQPVTVSP